MLKVKTAHQVMHPTGSPGHEMHTMSDRVYHCCLSDCRCMAMKDVTASQVLHPNGTPCHGMHIIFAILDRERAKLYFQRAQPHICQDIAAGLALPTHLW